MSINEAAMLAYNMHMGQTRAGQPFINHLIRVAGMVSIFGNDDQVDFTDNMIAAAWLHDIYEKTNLNSPALNCINPTVEHLVNELTNRFTKALYPVNRAARKKAEWERIACISPEAQIIKLCDRIDRLDTLPDKKFHVRYCDESQALAEAIPVGLTLRIGLFSKLARIRKKL